MNKNYDKIGLYKNLSSKDWSNLRNTIWLKIDKILEDNKTVYFNLNDYDKLKQEVMDYLINNLIDFKAFIREHKVYFESSIVAIYLLKTGKYTNQNEILTKSKFSGRWHIETIRKSLNLKLKEKIHSKLFIDKKKHLKECSSCRKILPFKDFSGRCRQCNDCRNIKNMINYYQKKLAVIIFITLKQKSKINVEDFLKKIKKNHKFELEIKCNECGLSIEFLPALEFHHPNLKKESWDKLRTHPLDSIIRRIDRENCIIICSNCHKKKHSIYFYKYKNEIMSKLSENSPQNRSIIRLYMKRIILEDLYKGIRCSNCMSIDIDLLPAIQFHHPNLRTIGWHRLRNYKDIEYVKKKLISEECVALCSNCHRMIEDKLFKKYKNEILSKYLLKK